MGLHAIFFQSQWNIVEALVCAFVKECFHRPEEIEAINETHLVLISKGDNPKNLKNLRLIDLCDVVYKIITKRIVNRIKPHISYLISPSHCSLIPGRHSNDNIVIVQEIIHSENMKNRKGWMAIKVDLNKAYDRLS